MQIILYNVTDDNNVVNKNIESGSTVSMVRTINTNIVNPSFLISKDIFNNQNYLFCDELQRYYFINNVTLLPGGMLQLDCSVDVLTTYKDSIKNLTCTVARAENNFSGYLPDSSLPLYAFEEIVTRKFPNAIDDDSLILMTIG